MTPIGIAEIMLNLVPGSAQTKAYLAQWVANLEAGHLLPDEIVKQLFGKAKQVEYTHMLTSICREGQSNVGILAAHLLLYLPTNSIAEKFAIGYLKECIESDDDYAFRALTLVAGLDKVPLEFKDVANKLMDSDSVKCRLAGANVAGGFPHDYSPELLVKALRIVRPLLENEELDLRRFAAHTFAGFNLPIKSEKATFVDLVKTDRLDLVAAMACRLGELFSEIPELIETLQHRAESSENWPDAKSLIYRNLGRICKNDSSMREWLISEFFRVGIDHDELILGLGYGIIQQDMPFPKEVVQALVTAVSESSSASLRSSAATLLGRSEVATLLTEANFDVLKEVWKAESDDLVRTCMIDAFFKGSSLGIPAAIELALTSERGVKAVWIGTLSSQLERFGAEFLKLYKKHACPELDELMPFILSQAVIGNDQVLAVIKRALSSESELERHHGLVALGSSGSGVADATPELTRLFLSGNDSEKEMAKAALLRIGSATWPYLREFDEIHGADQLKRFQLLQRLLSMDEVTVKHAVLVNFSDVKAVKTFVVVGSILEEQQKMPLRALVAKTSELLEQDKWEGCRDILPLPDSNVRIRLAKLGKYIAAISGLDEASLISGSSGQQLTALGQQWLPKCKEYLRLTKDATIRKTLDSESKA